MKIHFKISYFTQWGQRLLVSGNLPELGNGELSKSLSLQYKNGGDWVGEIDVKLNSNEPFNFNYKYILFNEKNAQYTYECGDDRNIDIDHPVADHFFCFDQWNSPAFIENTFLTAPFAEVLLRDEHEVESALSSKKYTHIFRVKAPLIPRNQAICVVGNSKTMGEWSTAQPVLLRKTKDGYWQTEIDLSKMQGDAHYKYGLYDPEDKKFNYFESGPDRVAPNLNSKKTVVHLDDGFVRLQSQTWRGAGVGLPVFSIRTRKSFGVGDFGDITLLVDWAEKVGLKLIQVLPLNDTIGTHTDADVLPYAAISAFALNPLFLNLPAIGKLPAAHPLQKEYKEKQTQLNALELIAFLEVVDFKLQYAREVYLTQKDKFLKNKDFLAFFEKNEFWLVPYAAYCVLRDRFATPDYRQWKELLRK